MTETFAIGRANATSPFREETFTELEVFALPVEPEVSPPSEELLESTTETTEESCSPPVAVLGEQPATRIQGQSAIAVQAARQWDSVDRPAGWIGKVYGMVVHTTGGGLPASAKDKGIYHTVRAVEYYSQSHGCHYVNGWRGVTGGDLLQVANEREQANGVGVGDQRRSIDQGRFEKDLPAAVVAQWRARWPGVEHPLRLLPGTRTANSCYMHVECVPCVFHHGGRLVTEATPMRPGLRFTQAQHEAVALLACDIARRNGWPLQEKWWCTPRLLGHEDLTPYNRHDKVGGWDPGGMRAAPYFDWDFVYQMIERECRVQAAPARPSWWPFSEAKDELFTASPDHDLPAESWAGAVAEQEQEDEGEHEEWEQDDREEYAAEPESEAAYEEPAYGYRGLVDEGEQALEGEDELEAEPSFLEPFRVTMAVARGQSDEKALTNGVFFARHPELGVRAIAPGEKALAAEWLDIRDRLVRPLLARAGTPMASRGGSSGASGVPTEPFGTLTLNAPGQTPFSYRFTAEDALWTAKLVILEAGGQADADSAAVIWAMFNRYALVRHTLYKTFHSFIRAYSTTLQPVLLNWKAAQRHVNSPEFVPSGGTYTTKGAPPGISKGQLKRHLAFQARAWADLPAPARTLTLDALRGTLPNPGIGLASEFVSTRILWMQAKSTKREPTEQEWRTFTQNFPARVKKPYAWIGDVPHINQRKNAFFQYLSDANLPVGAVSVVP
jgi:hypothetical protein